METIKEKIKQMTLVEKASLLSGKNFWETRKIERLGIPSIMMTDGPHGLRKQESDGDHLGLVAGVKATAFPTAATLANSWNVDLLERVGTALGLEAKHHKVSLILGPGLNIKRNPLCGRNFEYYSEDPYLSGKLAASFVKGIQSNGVGACLKHFAANNQETLRLTNDSIVDERTLHEIYLTGFEIAVKEAKPKAVMSAYNKINGIYANDNSYLLQNVLRDTWKFDGMVVTDWGGGNDNVAAVIAGSHLEMPHPGLDSIKQVVDAVESKTLSEDLLDKRVEELLNVIYDLQITEEVDVDYELQHELAMQAAEESIVLLENNGVLPLLKDLKVGVIGDFAEKARYQGEGSSLVNAYKVDHFLQVTNSKLPIIGYEQGFDRSGKSTQTMIDQAIKLAERVDVVLVFIGLQEVAEVEGRDRDHLRIGDDQLELLKQLEEVHTKKVAILSAGSVVEMPWSKQFDAVLYGALPGQAGAKAILNTLLGKVNPSGKLSETYGFNYEQCPSADIYPAKEATSEYREGLYVGYRYYDKINEDVRYPFGYGLSYTTFSYDNLVISEDGVTFTIANTGSLKGSEIAQLYVGKDQSKHYRALRELKGFGKIELEPGESKEVKILFDEYTFRIYDITKQKFVVEEGTYHIQVGSSSRDFRLDGNWNVAGEILDSTYDIPKEYFSGEVKGISALQFEKLYQTKLPNTHWDRTKLLDMNSATTQMIYAKSWLARTGIKILIHLRDKSYQKGKPNLDLYFLTNMPFRDLSKMSNGSVSMEMTTQILRIVNGKFFRGFGGLIKAFRSHRKELKKHV